MVKKIAWLLCLVALPIFSYEYKPTQWLVRGIVGNSIYFVKDSRTIVDNNIVSGVEFEYMMDSNWSLISAARPLFAINSLSLEFGLGAKYRFVNHQSPFVPFVSLALTPSVFFPTTASSKPHFNLGLRPTAGFEYFVGNDLALGIEAAFNPSFVMGGGTTKTLEATFEILTGATFFI
ncbi:MAG: hypothetical protein WCK49_09960 [Myxococcaceae bacterium]